MDELLKNLKEDVITLIGKAFRAGYSTGMKEGHQIGWFQGVLQLPHHHSVDDIHRQFERLRRQLSAEHEAPLMVAYGVLLEEKKKEEERGRG